jgi:hypothetical protein
VSGFTLGNEFATSLPEADQIAAQKAANLTSLKYANAFVSQPLSWIAPDPRLTELTGGPNFLNYVPYAGGVEQMAGLAGHVIDSLGTVRNAITGRNDDWKLPGMTTLRAMGDHADKTREEIQRDIAAHTPLAMPDPNNETDQITDAVGSLTGMGLPTIGKGLAKVITDAAPRGTGWLAHLMTPSTENVPTQLAHSAAVAPALVGLDEAGAQLDKYNADKATAAATAATTGAPPTPTPAPETQIAAGPAKTATDASTGIIDLSAPAPTQVAQPTQQRQTTPPGVIDLSGGADQPIDLSGANPTVPMQQGQGPGTMGLGAALATLIGIGAGVRAGRMARERNAAVTQAGRDLRMNDPAYAAAAQDNLNQQIRQGMGPITSNMNGATPAPLPEANTLRTTLNQANNAILDRTARGQEIIRNLGTPTSAEALAHEYGQLHNPGAQRVKFEAFLDTGYHPETGVQMRSPDRLNREIAGLDEDRQQTLMNGLFSYNEEDNRKNNRASFAQLNPGKTPTPNDIRHDAYNHDDAALEAAHNTMMADPQLAQIAQDIWDQGKKMREIYARMGVMPRSQAAQLDAAHPHYIPETDITGKVMSPLSQRDRTRFTGVDQPIAKPWVAQSQALEGMHNEVALRAHYRDLYDSLSEAQVTHPNAARVFTEVPAPTDKPVYYSGGDAREGVVAIHRSSGVKYYQVHNPEVYNMLTGDSLKRAQIVNEMATYPRRIYQNFTTGIGSLASGGFAAGRNLAYTTLTAPINAPRGSNAGLIHAGVRKLTGGYDSGIARGLDTFTNALGAYPYSYLRGVADRRVHNVANILDRGATNPINTMLRERVGDVAVDKMQQALDNYYKNSVTYEMQAKRGIGGGGFGPATDLKPLGLFSDKRASIQAAQHVPQLFHSGGEWMGAKPAVIRLHNAVQEALGHISDAGHESFYRMNRDNTSIGREALGAETRALTGDPSVGGANKLLKFATDILPYSNITLQGGTRLVRSFADRPLTSAMATVGGIGTLKLISLLTAMQSPQTFKNYEDELSTQEHASQLSIYLPNGQRWPIPLAQELEPIATMMESLVANGLNVAALSHDPLTFQSVHKFLLDFLGGHVSTAMIDQLKYGAAQQISPFTGHPFVGQLDPYKLMQGNGFWGSFKSAFEGGASAHERTLPNQVPDFMHEGVEGKDWTALIGAIFGTAGTAVMDRFKTIPHYLQQFGNWSDTLGQVGHDWLQSAGDRNPLFTPLMDHQMRMAMLPPIIEQTERELRWMKPITGMRTEPLAEGTTGRGRNSLPVYADGPSKIPTEPTMRWMWGMIEGTKHRIANQENAIANLRKQMTSVGAEGMDVNTRRAWMNDKTRELADKYRFIHNAIQDTNYEMSKALGRNVQIGMKIDWQKGPEQFSND